MLLWGYQFLDGKIQFIKENAITTLFQKKFGLHGHRKYFYFFLRFYLFERQRERERALAQEGGGAEEKTPC